MTCLENSDFEWLLTCLIPIFNLFKPPCRKPIPPQVSDTQSIFQNMERRNFQKHQNQRLGKHKYVEAKCQQLIDQKVRSILKGPEEYLNNSASMSRNLCSYKTRSLHNYLPISLSIPEP